MDRQVRIRTNEFTKGICLFAKQNRVLEADVFERLLRMETHRAVRSRKSLVLLSLELPSTRDLSSVIDRLSSSVRATDYIGWRESGKRLGILFTEVESERGEDIAKLLSAKIGRLVSGSLANSPSNVALAERPTATLLPSGRSYVVVATGTT
jgi:hypothetical protein